MLQSFIKPNPCIFSLFYVISVLNERKSNILFVILKLAFMPKIIKCNIYLCVLGF